MTGISLALAAAIATAFSHVLAKDCVHRQGFTAFLVVRTTAATILLTILMLIRDGMAELRSMPTDLIVTLVGLGLFCPLLTNVTYFSALKRLRVNVAIPVFHCFPAIAFVLGLLFLKLPFSLLNLVGVLGVVAGTSCFCIRRVPDEKQHQTRAGGIALVLVGALLMASATVCWKVLLERASPLMITFFGVGTACASLWIVCSWRLRSLNWGGLATNLKTALSGILIFGVSNLLSIHAMKDLSPDVVFAVVSSSVLWVGVLALVVLKEKWTSFQTASAVLVFAGVVVLGIGR
ncbi:MAG: DMT family transporter [Planctomycetota bacterium]|jgi:drug/metabolite transporter (DMT)-like permease|nr:DMT family transporter [Planctomycetota bacterium]MDP7249720.1 DMT family transporter [Planctomycetota bacterium]